MKGHRWFAAVWARMARAMERGPLGEMRRELLRDLRGDVVEIGAGVGTNFAHYPPEARVRAFEPDPFMLERARPNVTPNVSLEQAPAEHLPAPDASADAVVTTLVLCTVDDVSASLAEIRRVLRPGGELRFIEHVRSGGALGRVQDFVQPVYGWFSGGCQANRRTEQALRDAGFDFTRIEHTKLSPYTPAIVGAAKLRA